MKIYKSKNILAAVCANMILAISVNSEAGDKLTIQTKWETQEQCAG